MIGDNIRYIRKMKGYSQGQLARNLNIRQASVSLWESNKTKPDVNYLAKMSEMFGVPVDFFFSDEPRRELDNVHIRKSAIPIIGEIACGSPITAEENITGYADLPDGIHADFALICKGDSMIPTFQDKDLVLIRKQPEVEDRQIAAISINGEATLKRIYKHNSLLLLIADNPQYKQIIAGPEDDIIIHGLAVGFTRMFE